MVLSSDDRSASMMPNRSVATPLPKIARRKKQREYPSFITFREDLVRLNFGSLSSQRLEDFQEIETQNAGFFLKIISLTSMSTSVSGSHHFLFLDEFGK